MKSPGIYCALAACVSIAFSWLLLRQYRDPSVLISHAERHSQTADDSTPAPVFQRFKCGLLEPCPSNHFSFKLMSGAANIVSSKICWEDAMVTLPTLDEMKGGLAVVLINGFNGKIMDSTICDLSSGDPEECLQILRAIMEKTIVVMTSFNDIATKMNDEIRDILTELGSTQSMNLRFRDSWVFLGAKGINGQSPFEQRIAKNKRGNAYAGWPARAEVTGCVPRFQP